MHDANKASFQTHLQPLQAAQTLDQRHKRIGKLNVEIAEWLQVGGPDSNTARRAY